MENISTENNKLMVRLLNYVGKDFTMGIDLMKIMQSNTTKDWNYDFLSTFPWKRVQSNTPLIERGFSIISSSPLYSFLFPSQSK